jgi:pimeloyl-ACP methyl ester carboxylesterase
MQDSQLAAATAKRTKWWRAGGRVFVAVGLALGLAACATPVGVRSIKPAEAERLLTANVLSARLPSSWSSQFLARLGLTARFAKEPAAVLAELHAGLGGIDETRRLFTLSELAFVHADKTNDNAWFLASAAYAYAYLFPDDPRLAPDHYDPRLRLTMSLHNRALARGLAVRGSDAMDVGTRTVALPFGPLHIDSPEDQLRFGAHPLDGFVSVADMDVRGLRNHYRRSGIGAPSIAHCGKSGDEHNDRWLGPDADVPLTVLLRFHEPRASLRRGHLAARLQVFDPETVEHTEIAGAEVPVEADATAAIGYRLEGAPVWDFELAGFRRGDFTLAGDREPDVQLFMVHPYVPGRIPVVFVHGTASSPARWAEMLNEYQSDPVLRGRYQYWFFFYNTGNPIADSARRLRENLARVVQDVDPTGEDPALSRMVVIGHSQGGLLTKMTAVSSGDRFWQMVSDDPFDRVELKPETRDFAQRTYFVEPLPFVKRVVFVCTPHGGTVLASNWMGRLARRLIRLPGTIAGVGLDLARLRLKGAMNRAISIPTSIDNMSPTSEFLQTLRSLPVDPGVTAHSIIAVKGNGPVREGGDGVVDYESAHLEGVRSEFIVRSGHSSQAEPATIEEQRRILYEHLGEFATPLAHGDGGEAR